MKIVIINNGLACGGIQRASISMANYFATLGDEIFVVSVFESDHFYQLDDRIYFIEPKHYISHIPTVLQLMPFVRRTIRKIKPDTILAYGEWSNPFVCFSLVGLHYPLYLTDRMSPLLRLTIFHRILKRIFYPKADGIIAQTEFAKRVISERTGAQKFKVIPNPVNAIEKTNCEKSNSILYIGRLYGEKGCKYLVEAFARVDNTDWVLNIIGDGIEMPNLKMLAEKLNIADRVIFHGFKSNFIKEISEAKIYVLPSLSEGFPNALIEAMSVPVACVATKCSPAVEEFAQDGWNALLVPPADSEMLAQAMQRLMNDKDLRMQLERNAYDIRTKLCFDRIAKEYYDYITSCYHDNR